MDLFNNDWPSPPKLEEPSNIQMDLVTELQDGTFEPQQRARSNTWPLPRPENFVEPPDESDSKQASNQQLATDSSQAGGQVATSKKNSSRRNAWGNLSYADLITHAIGSATDKRLTLSQIYEWMVQNVPYFKDKGDSNSSAGWKNSIRHNLSLHNRFMRVQNEGTGKSSWWMLNPDAKPGKSVRRRAASMETSKYEKRRGRAKKRVEALRNESAPGLNDATPSPSSSVSEGLDLFPESPLHSSQGFPLSPDFRQRASSNASSCGRLSPIPALVEPEWNFANATPSATDFNQNSTSVTSAAQAQALDQLAGSLADDLTLQNKFLQGFSAATVIHNQPPPPYQPPQPWNATVAPTYGIQQTQCPIHRSLPCTCLHNSREGLSPSSGTDMSPAYPHSEPSPDPLGSYNTIVLGGQRITPRPPSNSPPLTPTPQKMNSLEQADEFIDFELSQSLPGIKWSSFELPTRIGILEDDNDLKFIDNFEDLENIRLIESVKIYNCLWDTTSADYTNRRAVDKAWDDVAQHNPQIAPSTLMGQFMEALNNQTQLDELNIDSFHGGLECNVEELIQQELSIDGLLDINIPITTTNPITTTHNNTQQTVPTIGGLGLSQSQPTNTHTKVQYSQTSVTPPSWVH